MSVGTAVASLALASIFGGECVLQRDAEVRIWGIAPAGERVVVSLCEERFETVATDTGRWEVVVGPYPAGGPHDLIVESQGLDPLKSIVWMGDVYLCSGQSNMQWSLRQTLSTDETIERVSSTENCFLFLVPKEGAPLPKDSVPARWSRLNQQTALDFSAVALYFAHHLRQSAEMENVPIALIDASYGGTLAEAWISAERAASDLAEETLRDSFFGWKPASMYNGMIAPVVPSGLRGVLWYQGESNCHDPQQYVRLMSVLIRDWRERFVNPDLPFLIVQLPNFVDSFVGGHFTWIREAQSEIVRHNAKTHLVVSIDTADGFDLHPKEKEEIGRRLALVARRQILRELNIVDHAPEPSRISFDGGRGIVEFDNPDSVRFSGCVPTGFELSDGSPTFHPAEVTPEAGRLIVYTDKVQNPKFLRYAWEGNPPVTLRGLDGLPVAPFRTDSFPPGGIEIQRMPAPWRVQTLNYEAVVSGDGRLTSFKVRNQEHLAPPCEELPGAGFGSIWGPVRLLIHRRITNDKLLCQMENGTIEYHFAEDGLRLRLVNAQGEPAPFVIPLREGHGVTLQDGAGIANRGGGSSGLSIRMPAEAMLEGDLLKLTLPSGESAEIELLVR